MIRKSPTLRKKSSRGFKFGGEVRQILNLRKRIEGDVASRLHLTPVIAVHR